MSHERWMAEFTRCCYHLAGHLVARERMALAVDDPVVYCWRRWVRTSVAWCEPQPLMEPDDPDEHPDAYLVATLAGPEAEAVWLRSETGMRMWRARRKTARKDRDGDENAVELLVEECSRTLRAARKQARSFVDLEWYAITETARELWEMEYVLGRPAR